MSQTVGMVHDFYPSGTPCMWLMHGGMAGATFYYRVEDLAYLDPPTPFYKGVPTRAPLRPTFETEPDVSPRAAPLTTEHRPRPRPQTE